jgi:nucleotide-binding universal stress UspA family protein
MQDVHRLLVPIDFSEASLDALDQAAALARALPAELALLHVVERLDAPVRAALKQGDLEEVHEAVRGAAHKRLEDLVAEHVKKDIRVTYHLREGSPANEILDAADATVSSCIVIATHGHSVLRHMLLGSTTERVLHQAHCSVLVARHRKDQTIRRIVVPFDFSEPSLEALLQARGLAKACHARLLLLHVIGPLPWPAQRALAGEKYPLLHQSLHRQAKEHLRETRHAHLPDLDACETHVLEGPVEDAILGFCAEHKADLIVMGSTGHSRLARFLVGSTTDKIVRMAPCSVLAVRRRN